MTVVSRLQQWTGVRPFRRHSLVLLVAGTVYVMIGTAYLYTSPSPYRTQGLYYALQIASYHTWGTIFILAGLMAMVSARWPPISETWGYILLTGLSSGWAAFYAAGVLFHDTPPTNIIGALCYGLLAFMWWAISGLVNPDVFRLLAQRIEVLQEENLQLHRELARYKNQAGEEV